MNIFLNLADQALQKSFNEAEINTKTIKTQLQSIWKALSYHNQPLTAEETARLDHIVTMKSKCAQLNPTQASQLQPLFMALHNQKELRSLPTTIQTGHMVFKFENDPEEVAVTQKTVELLRLHSEYFQAEFSKFDDRQKMHFPDVSKAAFGKISDYLITGNLPPVTSDDIAELIAATDFLRIPALSNYCRGQLTSLLASYDYDELIPYVAKECVGTHEAIPGFHRAAFQAMLESECLRIFNFRSLTSNALASWLQEQNIIFTDFIEKASKHFPEAAHYFRCLYEENYCAPMNTSQMPSLLDGLCYRLKSDVSLPEHYKTHFTHVFNSEPNSEAYFFLWFSIGTKERITEIFTKHTDAQLLIDWICDPAKLTEGNYATESLRRYSRATKQLLENLEKEAKWEAIISLVDRLLDETTPADLRLTWEAKKIKAQVKTGHQPAKLTDCSEVPNELMAVYLEALFFTKDYQRILYELRALEGRGLDDILQPFRVRFAAENLEIWADDILTENSNSSSPHTHILLELSHAGIVDSRPGYFESSAVAKMCKTLPAEDSFALSCAGYLKQQSGDYVAAVALYTQALVAGAPSGIRYQRAHCYLALGQQNKALADVLDGSRLSINPMPLLMLENGLNMIPQGSNALRGVQEPLQTLWRAKLLQQENLQSAIDLLATSTDPRTITCLCHLYLKQNEPSKALSLIRACPPSVYAISAVNQLFARMPLYAFTRTDINMLLIAASNRGYSELHAYLSTALQAFDSYQLPEAHMLKGEPGFWLLLNHWRTFPWEESRLGAQEDKQKLLERLKSELSPEMQALVPYFIAFVERNQEAVIKEYETHRAYLETTPYRALVCNKETARGILGENPCVPLVIQELLGLTQADPSRIEENIWLVKKQGGKPAIPFLDFLSRSAFVNRNDVKLKLASIYINEQRWNSAALVLKEVLAERPQDPIAKECYGRCLHQFEQFEEATQYLSFHNNVKYADSNGDWSYNEVLAHSFHQAGQWARIPAAVQTALGKIASDEKSKRVLYTLHKFYDNTGNFTSKLYNPYLVGKWLYSQKRFEDATRFLKSATKKKNTKFVKRAEFYAAQSYAEIGLQNEASKMIDSFMKDKAATLEAVGQEFFDRAEAWLAEFHSKKRKRPEPTTASLRKTQKTEERT